MKHKSVGHDGRRHSSGLWAVLLVQSFRNALYDAGAGFGYVVEQASRLADSYFQDARSLVYEQWRQCCGLNEERKIVYASSKPAAFRMSRIILSASAGIEREVKVTCRFYCLL